MTSVALDMITILPVRSRTVTEPVLLLLHGLGATGEVWHGLAEERVWPGEVVAPDLPGHGRSPRRSTYTFESLAAEVFSAVPADRPVVVLGHSLGGVLALTLAARANVVAACGLGIKLRWSDAELAKAADVAARPERVFATRAEAVDRWLKVSGLGGLMSPSHVAAGVIEAGDGWRVAVDPRAFAVGAPDVPALLAKARCPVLLAAGERDPMCPREHL